MYYDIPETARPKSDFTPCMHKVNNEMTPYKRGKDPKVCMSQLKERKYEK